MTGIEKRYAFDIDFLKRLSVPEMDITPLEYDTVYFDVNLLHDGQKVDLTGLHLEIAYLRPEGTVVVQDETNELEIVDAVNGIISIQVINSAFHNEGVVKFEFVLTDKNTGERIVSAMNEFTVREGIYSEDALKTTEIPLVADYEAHKNNVDAHRPVPAPEGHTGEALVSLGDEFGFKAVADAEHNHDERYALKSHTHDYADKFHNHDGQYAPLIHTHTEFSEKEHNHDEKYQTKLPSMAGNAGKVLAVKADENGYEYVDGMGDMHKSVYDTDGDGVVDRAEALRDPVGKEVNAGTVIETVEKSHTHSNKGVLDKIIYTGRKGTIDLADYEYYVGNTNKVVVQDDSEHKLNAHRVDFADNLTVDTDPENERVIIRAKGDITKAEVDAQISVVNEALHDLELTKSDKGHVHDDRYYTETEIDSKLADLNADINTVEQAKANKVHTHVEADITDLDKYTKAEVDSKDAGLRHEFDDKMATRKSEVDTALAGKSNVGHKHYEADILDLDKYSQSEIDIKVAALQSNIDAVDSAKSDVGHTHTEAEIINLDKYSKAQVDDKLATKSDVGHLHTEADITDLDKYTQLEVDTKLATKSNKGHTHTEADITDLDKYSKVEVDTKLGTKSDKGHLHVEADIIDLDKYAKAEVDSKVYLVDQRVTAVDNAKSDKGHTHVEADIIDLDKYTKAQVDSKVATVDNRVTALDSAKSDKGHVHTEADIIDLDKYTMAEVDGMLATKSAKGHGHTIADVSGLQTELDSKSNIGHGHSIADVTELQTALDQKSTVGHTHVEADITDLDKYTKAEVDSKLATKSDSTHNHDTVYSKLGHVHVEADITNLDKYTKAEVDGKLATKASSTHNHDTVYSKLGHTHDDRYYTETEVDGMLADKSDVGHGHGISDISGLQTELDSKSAITHNHDTVYSKLGHAHVEADITDLDKYTQAEVDAKLATKSDSSHLHDDRYSRLGHAHVEADITDLDKYTKAEVDAKLATKSDSTHNHDGVYVPLVNSKVPAQYLPDGVFDGLKFDTTIGAVATSTLSTVKGTFYISNGGAITVSTGDTVRAPEGTFTTGTVSLQAGDWVIVTDTDVFDIINNNDVDKYVPLVRTINGKALTNNIVLTPHDIGAEPAFSKNTAFNKNFGTIAGTVAEGNHNHDTVYSKLGHDHDDRYYTETEIDTKLAGKANVSHTHDDRYYTETEVDTKLSGKANVSHSHVEADIIDLDKYTQAEVDSKLSGKSDKGHTHDDRYYTETEIDTMLATMAPNAHTHTEADIVDLDKYTQTEVDNLLAGKSDTTHNHDGRYAPDSHSHSEYALATHDHDLDYAPLGHNHDGTYAPATHSHSEYALTTHNHDTVYSKLGHAHTEADISDLDKYSQAEVDALLADKADTTHNHDTRYALKSHSHINYALTTHNHDTVYSKLGHTHSEYALVSHGHAISDVTGLQTELDNKASTGHNHDLDYAPLNHNHDGDYSLATHSHSQYALTSHNHDTVYAPITHGHAITDVTGLQNALDDKADVGHNHDTAYAPKSHSHSEYALATHTHSQYALTGHDHDGVYEPVFTKNTAFNKNFGTSAGTVAEGNHTHSQYALTGHNHDTDYAPLNHSHSEYALVGHSHSEYETKFSKNTAFNKDFGTIAGTVAEGNHTHSQYALNSHDHDGDYAPLSHSHSQYALTTHNHDTVYSKLGHTHSEYALTGHDHDSDYAPLSHSHSDYSLVGHNHDERYAPKSHSHSEYMTHDYYLSGVSGSGNGTVTFTRSGLSNLSINLAHTHSEYASSNHTHDDRYMKISTQSQTYGTSVVFGNYGSSTALVAGESRANNISRYHNDSENLYLAGNTVYLESNADNTDTPPTAEFNTSGQFKIPSTGDFYKGSTKVSYEGHTHNEYASTSHTHDDRYYTETEVNNLLAGKANSSHSHSEYASSSHSHSWSSITSKPSTFPPSSHSHSEYASNFEIQDYGTYLNSSVGNNESPSTFRYGKLTFRGNNGIICEYDTYYSRMNVTMPLTTSTSSTLTDYAIGTVIAVYTGSSTYYRNQTATIYTDSSYNYGFVTSGNTGYRLDGTWRCRGYTGYSSSTSSRYILFQRVY
jgi:hypothetical protein